jgi:hypothetical protein
LGAFVFVAAPGWIDSEDGKNGTVRMALGNGDDFDADDFYEFDHNSFATLTDLTAVGPYMKRSGPFTMVLGPDEEDIVTIGYFDISLEWGETEKGDPTAVLGYVSAYVDDCQVLKDLVPSEYEDLIDEVCDENTLYALMTVETEFNPLDAVDFGTPTVGTETVSYEPTGGGGWFNGSTISIASTAFEFRQDGELVLSSLNTIDPLLFDYYSYESRLTEIVYTLPESFVAGVYDVDLFLGLHCFRMQGVTVPTPVR